MGRKKRKVEVSTEENPSGVVVVAAAAAAAAADDSNTTATEFASSSVVTGGDVSDHNNHNPHENEICTNQSSSIEESGQNQKTTSSSGYAVTTHSGEIIQEDIYVSDGSESEDDVEIILNNSRLGMMRRGLHQNLQQTPIHRQWTRQQQQQQGENSTGSLLGDDTHPTDAVLMEAQKRQREEEELAKLDPAQRAARLLQEKLKREEEQKIEERRRENEENAGRDIALFSKRTAFDIQFHNLDDKPWLRNVPPGQTPTAESVSEFFNYGMTEEDWLEYAQHQLLVRDELINAARQKRPPDPSLVPFQPRTTSDTAEPVPTPQTQTEVKETTDGTAGEENDADSNSLISQTETEKKADPSTTNASQNETETLAPHQKQAEEVPVGIGGAWGAGAPPGSLLAKLMEEQEMANALGTSLPAPHPPAPLPLPPPPPPPRRDSESTGYHHGPPAEDAGHYYYSMKQDRNTIKEESVSSSHAHDAEPVPQKRDRDYHDDRRSGSRDRRREERPHWQDEYGSSYYNGRTATGWEAAADPSAYYAQGGAYYGGDDYSRGQRGGYPASARSSSSSGRGGRGHYNPGGEYYPQESRGWKRSREGRNHRRR